MQGGANISFIARLLRLKNTRVIKGNYYITAVTETPVTLVVKLKLTYVDGKLLRMSVPDDVGTLICNELIYLVENVLNNSLSPEIVNFVKTDCTLRLMSSSTHLYGIRIGTVKESWTEEDVDYVLRETEKVLQDNLPQSTYIVDVRLS
jgi:hypothetical protein